MCVCKRLQKSLWETRVLLLVVFQFMACGDGENDMEMLHLAGLGVAMGNAAANTLAFADVQVGTNDEDGVAEAIERYVLDPCNNW